MRSVAAVGRNLHDSQRLGYEMLFVFRSRIFDRPSRAIDDLSSILVASAREIVHQSVDIVPNSALS
jgi:hypothetical protein